MPKPFPHRIVRTKNKHSRAVYQGNTIVIRLARNLSRTEEQYHIQNLLRRMTHLVLLDHKKEAIDPFRPLLEGNETHTITIGRRRITFTLRPGERLKAHRVRGGYAVTVSPTTRRKTLHRFLWSLLSAEIEEDFTALTHQINASTFRARIASVKIGYAATQWGSCSPRGRIMLNAALAFLPKDLQRYVITHELAHTRRSNHSDAFWREVESVLPGFRNAYRALHQYRLPTL